jgi:hypothetical protein
MSARCSILGATLYDLLKSAPAFGWLVMCLFAIPAYSELGWVAPVVCAVFSSIMSILATRDTLLYLSPSLAKYNLIEPFIQEQKHRSELTKKSARFKFFVAAFFTFTAVIFAATFLVIAYAVVVPERDSMPCDGKCEDCEEDQDCRAWVKEMEEDHPETAICPPAKRSAETDVTFSCLADGYWMICTSIVGAIWMVATRYIIKLAEANESQQRSLVRAGGDGDGDEGAEMTSELGPRAAEKPRV